MLALGVEYLLGRAIATDSARRNRAEWPPHPDRLYQALVATWQETEGTEKERSALEWLENCEPPSLYASDADERASVTHFVPVNDSTRAQKLLPEDRPRQARSFPGVVPHDPCVYFQWSDHPPEELSRALDELACRVTRLGHSSSLVRLWVTKQPPQANRIPGAGRANGDRLRVPRKGRIEQLERDFALGQWSSPALREPYGVPAAEDITAPGSIFHPAIVILRRERGTAIGLEHTLRLTRVLRNAVIRHCPDPVPEWVNGHDPDGGGSRQPHLAFIPLADIGYSYSEGRLLGVGIAVPREVSPEEAERCLSVFLGRAASDDLRLYDGRGFEWSTVLETRLSPPVALRDSSWTRASRKWATATPMAFDRHRKNKKNEDPARADHEAVARACRATGLPEPLHVATAPVSRIRGVPHARDFPALRRKSDNGLRYKTHLVVEFEEPVVGPILLGAGRFRGYGLCRPLRDDPEAS